MKEQVAQNRIHGMLRAVSPSSSVFDTLINALDDKDVQIDKLQERIRQIGAYFFIAVVMAFLLGFALCGLIHNR